MNFLYRTAQPVVPELPLIPEQDHHKDALQKSATTLEGLIADDPYQPSVSIEDGASNNGVGEIGGNAMSLDSRSPVPQGKHTDVLDDEGWITIPKKELPENWNDISDMVQLQPLDRSFLFPGEQVHILVCLSASKQDMQGWFAVSSGTSLQLLQLGSRGKVYYYYPLSALSDPAKLFNDLRWNISRPQGFEVVMRVRCSQGLQIQDYSGNFCKRVPTDIDLPAVGAISPQNMQQTLQSICDCLENSDWATRKQLLIHCVS